MQDSQLIRGDREPSRGNPNTQTWFIEGVESSLHDAVMAVKLAIRSGGVHVLSVPSKQQLNSITSQKHYVSFLSKPTTMPVWTYSACNTPLGTKWFEVAVDGPKAIRDNVEVMV
ncbi:hypothetical protein P692DRAFT_20814406 [Suillus brevipes Sb2]|nr:hypothetical protein P692DRAFT_20814406 [Suillus brevipes Sb2]